MLLLIVPTHGHNLKVYSVISTLQWSCWAYQIVYWTIALDKSLDVEQVLFIIFWIIRNYWKVQTLSKFFSIFIFGAQTYFCRRKRNLKWKHNFFRMSFYEFAKGWKHFYDNFFDNPTPPDHFVCTNFLSS